MEKTNWIIILIMVIIGILIIGSIIVPFLTNDNFLINFSSNYLSTVLGAALGVPIGLWVSRIERRIALKNDERATTIQAIKNEMDVLDMLDIELTQNALYLQDLLVRNDEITEIHIDPIGPKTMFWSSIIQSGVVNKISSSIDLFEISSAYEQVSYLQRIQQKYLQNTIKKIKNDTIKQRWLRSEEGLFIIAFEQANPRVLNALRAVRGRANELSTILWMKFGEEYEPTGSEFIDEIKQKIRGYEIDY